MPAIVREIVGQTVAWQFSNEPRLASKVELIAKHFEREVARSAAVHFPSRTILSRTRVPRAGASSPVK